MTKRYKKSLGHKTRFSDASTFDEICENCGATDANGSNLLNKPCPKRERAVVKMTDRQRVLRRFPRAVLDRSLFGGWRERGDPAPRVVSLGTKEKEMTARYDRLDRYLQQNVDGWVLCGVAALSVILVLAAIFVVGPR